MTDPDSAASPSDERGRTLALFPLSRVTEDIHAQFVHRDGRFYGGYVALRDPKTWITSARIAAYDAANPDAVELAWYPEGAGEAAA